MVRSVTCIEAANSAPKPLVIGASCDTKHLPVLTTLCKHTNNIHNILCVCVVLGSVPPDRCKISKNIDMLKTKRTMCCEIQ